MEKIDNDIINIMNNNDNTPNSKKRNYLNYILIALSSYFFSFDFIITFITGYKFFKENSKQNANQFLIFISWYLLGTWNTLLNISIIILYNYFTNFENINKNLIKYYLELFEFIKFCKDEKIKVI